jgi:hypothetical protein
LSEDDTELEIDAVIKFWEDICEEVRIRQTKYDAAMVKTYLKQRSLAEHDVRFIFSPGD